MEKGLNDESFWNERYLNRETGWDINQVSPPLKHYIDSIHDKSMAILIPGCGNAYEAEYLIENAFLNVTVLDISSVLVNKLKDKFTGKKINIIQADFFTHQGKYDLILEQTFFCALNPSLRHDYVKKMHNLLNENGRLAGVLFNKDFGNDHPPYGGSKEEYLKLFSPFFQILTMEDCYNSIPPRAGSELFIELEKNNNKT